MVKGYVKATIASELDGIRKMVKDDKEQELRNMGVRKPFVHKLNADRKIASIVRGYYDNLARSERMLVGEKVLNKQKKRRIFELD